MERTVHVEGLLIFSIFVLTFPQLTALGTFVCNDGTEVYDIDRCDGPTDCPDDSDEQNCLPSDCFHKYCYITGRCYNTRTQDCDCSPPCRSDQTCCSDGSGCYSSDQRCDGENQCKSGEDEDQFESYCTPTVDLGIILGVLAGVVIGCILIGLVICCLCQRMRRKQQGAVLSQGTVVTGVLPQQYQTTMIVQQPVTSINPSGTVIYNPQQQQQPATAYIPQQQPATTYEPQQQPSAPPSLEAPPPSYNEVTGKT